MWESFLIVSVLAGVGLPLLCGWWQGWQDIWLVPVTALACFAALVLALLLTLLVAMLVTAKRPPRPGRTLLYKTVLQMVRLIDRVCRVRVTVSGEALPEEPFVLISNHRSMFDPIVCLEAFARQTVVYISKPENFQIPLVGPVIRRCGFLAIDREDPRKAMGTIHQAVKLLTETGVSVAVYPEGTRSLTGELLPFHNGVLKIAQKAKVPVAVVTVSGTEQISKRVPLRRTEVAVRVAGVIPPEEFAGSSTAVLADRARDMMLAALT